MRSGAVADTPGRTAIMGGPDKPGHDEQEGKLRILPQFGDRFRNSRMRRC
jgi:hypothetical protein